MTDIKPIVEIAQKLRELSQAHARLSWAQFVTGFDFGVVQAYEKTTELLKDKRSFETILAFQGKPLSELDRRRVEIIHLTFKPYHLSSDLNELDLEIERKSVQLAQILNTHRFVLDGRTVRSTELTQILRSEPDRAIRKKAFLARAQGNQPLVDGGFIDLLKLRREYARLYGARDYVDVRLEFEELSPSVFAGWAETVHQLLPSFARQDAAMAEKYLGGADLMPWDRPYIGAQLAPQLNQTVDMSHYFEVLQHFFAKLGFDLGRYNITYDVFPRRNKSEWGYHFGIDTGRDSRILANVENRYHEFGVLLHETGHGIHALTLDPDDVILNMGTSSIIHEGFANTMGDFLYEKEFFGQFFQDEMSRAAAAFDALKSWVTAGKVRDLVTATLFDQALYRRNLSSLDDINGLFWEQTRSLLKQEPYTENPPWAYRIHHTTHPVYLHSYVMGDVTAAMLKSRFCALTGRSSIVQDLRGFGDFVLKEVIKPSGTYPFEELFRRISGEPFSLKYLAD